VDAAVHEEARAARIESSKCQTEHGQAVCGEVERVVVGVSKDRLTAQ
jgi:hypothetical protein